MQAKHHATIFEGDHDEALAAATTYVRETLAVSLHANPDLTTQSFDRLTVNDARALKSRASQTPLGTSQVFIIALDSITRESQNALLKLLEEPADETFFVFIVPTVEILLPTVRSRLAYGGRAVAIPEETTFASTFLNATIQERQKLLEPIIKNKDRPRARRIVDALEHTLHEEGVTKHEAALRELVFVRTYLPDTSSSLKMLLEHLAVTL